MITCIICNRDRDSERRCNTLHQTNNLKTGKLIAICCKCFH